MVTLFINAWVWNSRCYVYQKYTFHDLPNNLILDIETFEIFHKSQFPLNWINCRNTINAISFELYCLNSIENSIATSNKFAIKILTEIYFDNTKLEKYILWHRMIRLYYIKRFRSHKWEIHFKENHWEICYIIILVIFVQANVDDAVLIKLTKHRNFLSRRIMYADTFSTFIQDFELKRYQTFEMKLYHFQDSIITHLAI